MTVLFSNSRITAPVFRIFALIFNAPIFKVIVIRVIDRKSAWYRITSDARDLRFKKSSVDRPRSNTVQ